MQPRMTLKSPTGSWP
ncbi:hypothetical protein LEMLEM_LOCUS21001 [Lemmus lemmus]